MLFSVISPRRSPQREQPSSRSSPWAPRGLQAEPLTPVVSRDISHLALRAVRAARGGLCQEIFTGAQHSSRFVFFLFMHLCINTYHSSANFFFPQI